MTVLLCLELRFQGGKVRILVRWGKLVASSCDNRFDPFPPVSHTQACTPTCCAWFPPPPPPSACLLSRSSVLCSDTLLLEKPPSLGDLAAVIADPGANPACLSASQALHCALVGLLTKDVGDALYSHLNAFDDSSVSGGPAQQHTVLVPTHPPPLLLPLCPVVVGSGRCSHNVAWRQLIRRRTVMGSWSRRR